MKKLILITGIILISYVVLTAVITSNAAKTKDVQETQAQTTVTQSAVEPTVYIVKSEDNRVVVYLNGVLYLKTDALVSNLPKSDKNRLEEGIVIKSKEELKSILEDYCS